MNINAVIEKMIKFNVKLNDFKRVMEECKDHTLDDKWVYYDESYWCTSEFVNHIVLEFYRDFCIEPLKFEYNGARSWLQHGFLACLDEVNEGVDELGKYYLQYLMNESYDEDFIADFLEAIRSDSIEFAKKFSISGLMLDDDEVIYHKDHRSKYQWLRDELDDAIGTVIDKFFEKYGDEE